MYEQIESINKYNYLIVMPRFVDKVGEWYHFPLGVPYISACLKKAGFHVFTINMNSEESSASLVIDKAVKENNIDVVLTGGLSIQYFAIKEILAAAKAANPDIITVAGGGVITSEPRVGMQVLEYADYGIIGEGEITTTELCYALETDGSIDDVNGLIYWDGNGDFKYTAPRKEIKDLDTVPFPDYDGFGFNKIMEKMPNLLGINDDHAITMSSSRSCPFQCSFCFHTSGSHYRKRSLDNFFKELDILVGKYNVKYIFVSDELFAYNIDRVREFCQRIKPYHIKWMAQFRVSDVTEEMVQLLKDGNCVTMGFGIESADNRILKSMNKKITIEQTEKALALVYKHGIQIQGGFIFGDKEETLETANNTLNWWKEHPEYALSLNFISAYPGTPLYKYAVKEGIIKDEVQFVKDGCPVVNLSKMSQEEVNWLAKQVVDLPQSTFVEPENITDISFDKNRKSITFTAHCTACGQKNTWENVRFFTRNVLSCSKCGKKHKLPILKEMTISVNKNTEKLLTDYGKVAFWGINDYFANFVEHLDAVLKNDNCFIVDIAKTKQGAQLLFESRGGTDAPYTKTVQSPEVIKKENIDTVVIPVISAVDTIRKQIQQEYKCVTNIYSILDLIDL